MAQNLDFYSLVKLKNFKKNALNIIWTFLY